MDEDEENLDPMPLDFESPKRMVSPVYLSPERSPWGIPNIECDAFDPFMPSPFLESPSFMLNLESSPTI